MYTTETSSEFIKVSKTNPCPLCDKPDWCKTSPDNTVVMCPRTDTAPTGWKRIKDTVDGHGIYKLETGESFQKQVSGCRPTKRISKPKPAPIPAGSKLLRLPAPQRGPEPQKPQYIPKGVPASAVLITYSYSDTQQVHRFEWPDPNEPKGRDKTYRQSHINGEGEVEWKKGGAAWPAYRIDEVAEILIGIPDDEPVVVLTLEGEPNVELARFHAIAALTLQGSSWSDAEITRTVEALRATGKNITLAKLRDNDSTGVKKGSQIQSVSDRLQFPCIVIDPVAIYPDIPDKGDIKEILDNMDADEFIRRLEEEIHRQAAESAQAIELEDIEEEPIDKSPTNTNISMLEAAANEAREILRSELDELTTNIKLEELRQVAGVNNNVWEDKIIKPLKRGMNGERFKLELLALMQMDDQVERLRQSALMASRYNMGAGAFKEAMSAMKSRTETAESRLWSLNEVFNLQSEGLQWIVPELLPCAESVFLSAPPKGGKTLLAVDLAFCVATGEEKFLGQKVKTGKVLLVSVDESLNSTRSKLLKRGFRLEDNENIKVLPQWDITQMATLEAFLEDYRPDVVIVDSLKRICKGSAVSENSAEFSDNIYDLKELFTRYGAAGVLIHHTNKNADALGVDRLRGSSAIAGSVWGVWQVDHIPKQDPNNSKKLIIDPKDPKRIFSCFLRDSEGQTLDIELNLENNSWICHGIAGEEAEAAQQRETIRERILRVLEKHGRPLNGPEILELTELTEKSGSVYSELNRMVSKKVISAAPAPGNKRYTLYSLPHFQTEKILPPLPPTVSVPNAIYESQTHTENGFQTHSSIHSKHIATYSTVTVESEMLSIASDCDDRVSGIDSKIPLSQGGGEVKCVSVYDEAQPSEPVPIAPLEPETTPTPPPASTAPKSTAAEVVNQIVAALRKAIAENDAATVKQIVRNTKKRDSTGRLHLAVKANLKPEENKACQELVNRKQSPTPDPNELAAKIRQGIAENDEGRILVCIGYANRCDINRCDKSHSILEAVKARLSDTEKEACRRILSVANRSKHWEPESIESPAQPTNNSSPTAPEAEPETAPTAPIALPDNSQPPEPAEPATVPTESQTVESPAQPTDTSSEAQPEPAEPATAPMPAPKIKIGDRVRVSMRRGQFQGKCGEITSIEPKRNIGKYGVRLDSGDRLSLSASQIELVADPEVSEDE